MMSTISDTRTATSGVTTDAKTSCRVRIRYIGNQDHGLEHSPGPDTQACDDVYNERHSHRNILFVVSMKIRRFEPCAFGTLAVKITVSECYSAEGPATAPVLSRSRHPGVW